MLQLPETTFRMDAELLASELERAGKTLDRPRKRLMGLLEKGIKESKPDQPKSCTLLFLRSPLGFKGNDNHELTSIQLGINRLEGEDKNRKAVLTEQQENLDCGLAFRSIGYKSVGISGVPFDERKGIVPNMDGKVMDKDQKIVSWDILRTCLLFYLKKSIITLSKTNLVSFRHCRSLDCMHRDGSNADLSA